MSMTNAQAALIAAASAAPRGTSTGALIRQEAQGYLEWLIGRDAAALRAKQERGRPPGGSGSWHGASTP